MHRCGLGVWSNPAVFLFQHHFEGTRAIGSFLNLTTLQALQTSPVEADHKVQIGSKLTRGLGAGGDPAIGTVRAVVGKQYKDGVQPIHHMEN